ncbi:hypothetical protein M758_10G078100 [Ceratodon purpureus]|nr:hypothetical protein M758_10G078100 [Ceratodon purpureus]
MLEKHCTRARKFKSSEALWRRTPPLRLFVTLGFKLTVWRRFSNVVSFSSSPVFKILKLWRWLYGRKSRILNLGLGQVFSVSIPMSSNSMRVPRSVAFLIVTRHEVWIEGDQNLMLSEVHSLVLRLDDGKGQ